MNIKQEFERDGRVWLRNVIDQNELSELKTLSSLDSKIGERVSAKSALLTNIKLSTFTSKIKRIWPNMRPVRCVAFNKSSKANWGVPWHQDRVIAVDSFQDVNGYSNWTQKTGVWHCEPPVSLLQEMLFVRIHLDASTKENGAMEIALGTHKLGAIAAQDAGTVAAAHQTELTLAEPGDVLILAMLTLHRSLSSQTNMPRRTFRVDYGSNHLPEPLSWAI